MNRTWKCLTVIILCIGLWEILTHTFLAKVPDFYTTWFLTADVKHEEKLNMTIFCGGNGRLGNQIFKYACLYGLALKNNRQGQVPLCIAKDMNRVFDISLPTIPNPVLSKGNLEEQYPVGYVSNIGIYYNIPRNATILTGSAFKNTHIYVEHVKDKLRKELVFKKHLRNYARNTLKNLKGNRSEVVFVGVHVRRTDYPNYLQRSKLTEAKSSYFEKAAKFFRDRFSPVQFVVVSDDLEWCRKRFHWKDAYLPLKSHSAEHDLALLSHCNHSIIDYGTFGWWAAFLTGGEVIYFDGEKEYQARHRHLSGFFMPYWHRFSELTNT